MHKRVFITGLGCLSASGANLAENWQALINGRVNTKKISAWDLSTWPTQLGGELQDFNPAKILPDKKLMKAISWQDAMGLVAAQEAIEHSEIINFRNNCQDPKAFNQKTGVFVGSPGNKYLQQYDFLPLLAKTGQDVKAFARELFTEVHPMWLLRILPNNVLAYTGILFGFQGANHNVANHAVSGMQALIEAYYAIQSGIIDRAVVVAYDLGIDPQAMYYYAKLGLLTNSEIAPFDANHSGTILANGAAALILENQASVQERAIKPAAEFLAGKASTEGESLFGLAKEPTLLEELIQELLSNNKVYPLDLSFIIAHGNGSKGSDLTEAKCLTNLFSEYNFLVSSFKWSMGHTLAASGLMDTVLACKALTTKVLPGIATLKTIHACANKLNLSNKPQTLTNGKVALILNRGFASMNAGVLIKAYEE
ncbi:MAG: 3-oxoacyl-ACP synthase [Gammaproteobacteria bacterium RIFCSPHIGHO2_12_FULL_41_15]|nr:MAG: 3-oxoacyl-ACP synthase [Gammaproteobacteria bacterium RIFCSPHIGHO2_12_FULL_41_15]